MNCYYFYSHVFYRPLNDVQPPAFFHIHYICLTVSRSPFSLSLCLPKVACKGPHISPVNAGGLRVGRFVTFSSRQGACSREHLAARRAGAVLTTPLERIVHWQTWPIWHRPSQALRPSRQPWPFRSVADRVRTNVPLRPIDPEVGTDWIAVQNKCFLSNQQGWARWAQQAQ